MIRKQSTKLLYESIGSAAGFARRMYHLMGIADERGNRHRGPTGRPVLKDPVEGGQTIPRIAPNELSLKDLAEGLIGDDWAQRLNPDMVTRIALQEQEKPLLEAGTNMVMPSWFANINAFTAVVTGLLEISVLKGFENPDYIADQLMPVENTRMFAGRKVIGSSRIGDQAEQRMPGMPTKRAGFGERWILQPLTVENALSCEVTQEAVYLDLTGEVIEQANGVGGWLGYRKELRVIDAFIGVTNSYNYKGTSYNSYISAGYFDNDVSGNELLHWNQVETVFLKFRDMKDPETNTRVQISPNRWLVNQEKLFTANAITGASNQQYRDAPGSTSNPQFIREFPTPKRVSQLGEPITSPLVYERCTAANGLGLSNSNAGKYWWVWDSTNPPFKYVQNWPLRVQQAAPNQMDMIDRGIVLFTKADERGVPMVYEPRRIIRCKP